MADYNIQMKQFNGGDYDNLYPATLASIVGYNQGGGIQSTNVQDALREVNTLRPYIVRGSYVGTGVYGVNNPNTLVFDREVSFVVIMDSTGGFSDDRDVPQIIWIGQSLDTNRVGTIYRTFSYSDKTLGWYANSVAVQMNQSGHTYLYFAVTEGSYSPYVGQTWIITENSTFTVPVTGNYRLELHGGGGGKGGNFTTWTRYDGGAGGGSGEVYNNISLTANTQQHITIGQGGVKGSNGSENNPATAGQQGGTTSFGSYSIAGGYGGGAATDMGFGAGGAKSGNIATAGTYKYDGEGVRTNVAGKGGSQHGSYGNGQAYDGVSSGLSGAVILTYLGG